MAATSGQIERELLARGFASYPRSIATGFVFASLTAGFLWPGMPHPFLAAWMALVAAIAVVRLAMARAFTASPADPATLGIWARRAAIGYGAIGFAWGALGAATILFAPSHIEYAMVVGFLIALFSVLQSQSAAAHPMVHRAFHAGAWIPVVIAALVMPAHNYVIRLMLIATLIVSALLVSRSGYRSVIEALQIRDENVELLHDLTRQKEELDKANRAKTRFFAAASHDLRQPMQAIVLLVESLQERVAEPETRRIVGDIHSSVNSMAALVNALLDISKFDAGTVKPDRSHFRVSALLERLRSNYAQEAAGKGLELVVMPSSAIVATDQVLLYRILSNITSNALRYTERGKVVIGCRRRKDALEIAVWDTGPGIAEEDLEEVFREFHQLGNPHRDREQGLGLGLAIVERTAHLLGHAIVVKSRVGHGSMFAVRVPYGDAAGIQATERVRGTEWTSLEGCRALVVEDEKDIRAAMALLLESWGCDVVAASSGADVRSWLARGAPAPHVVIADYRLPGEDNGILVIRAIQALHPGARGILVTGDIAPELLREAEETGLKLLHKPLRPARLRSLLGSVWRERSAAQRPVEPAAIE